MFEWTGSLDHLNQSATFPAWVAVGSAAFFGLVFLLSLVRAERTVANGSLAALTFAGLAIAASIGLHSSPESTPERSAGPSLAGLPALACIDDLAGETALAACEKVLFSAPDTVAAAVAYTTARINRLIALSAAGNGNRIATPDEQALRNAVERDRYGLVAYVLATRDKCQPSQCAAFAAMADHKQVASNMDGLIYEGLVAKYAPTWAANMNTVQPMASGTMTLGRPSSIDFPTAASIPPVNIMTAEPPASRPAAATSPQPEAASPAPPPAGSGGPYVPARDANAPKRRATQKRAPAPAQPAPEPVQLAPSVASER
jgi:hypothetical protein